MVSSGPGSQTCRAGKRGKAKEFAVMEWWRLLDRFAKGYTGHSCSACHFSSNWEAVLHQLNSEWEQEMEHLRTWRVMCYYSRPIPIFSVWSLLFNLNKVIPNYSYFYCPSCTVKSLYSMVSCTTYSRIVQSMIRAKSIYQINYFRYEEHTEIGNSSVTQP